MKCGNGTSSRFNYMEREAYAMGWRVSEDGLVINPRGQMIGCSPRQGYLRFRPAKGSKEISVHRLQAYQKFGEQIYDPRFEVRHFPDNNTQNNSWDNIQIGTPLENAMDKPAEVRLGAALKAAEKNRKHDYLAVIRFYQACRSMKKAARYFGTSPSTIHYIVRHSRTAQSLSALVRLSRPADTHKPHTALNCVPSESVELMNQTPGGVMHNQSGQPRQNDLVNVRTGNQIAIFPR